MAGASGDIVVERRIPLQKVTTWLLLKSQIEAYASIGTNGAEPKTFEHTVTVKRAGREFRVRRRNKLSTLTDQN